MVSFSGSPAVKPASTRLPLLFACTGLLALAAGVTCLTLRPDLLAEYHYNQHVVAVTHLMVLGWILTVVMGSMYQLVPVALEARLHSERLAAVQYLLHLVGFVGMVWMFWVWNMKQVGHFGSILAAGVGLFVYNIIRTLRHVPRWNVTATAVSAALVWITLTIVAGLSLATAKCVGDFESGAPQAGSVGTLLSALKSLAGTLARLDAISMMHAHAHLGAVGCFAVLIVGVSYKLVPMFTLSEVQNTPRAVLSVLLLNIGLAGSIPAMVWQSPWKLLFAVVMATGLVFFGWELRAILRARKRRVLDWGLRYFLTSLVMFLPVSLLGLILAWPGLTLNTFTGRLENLYGLLGFLGIITFAILGMLYKIIPFLVWFSCYSGLIGKTRVPTLSELYSTRLQAVGYWFYLAGMVATSVGILSAGEWNIRVGCGLLVVAVATMLINVVKMLSHFLHTSSPLPMTAQPRVSPQPI